MYCTEWLRFWKAGIRLIDLLTTDQQYKTICADPPWMERGGGKIHRGADRHYPLMKTQDIAA